MTRKRRAADRRRRKRRSTYAKGGSGAAVTPAKVLASVAPATEKESMTSETFQAQAEVLKVDRELGLVFGWAIVCKIAGEPYFDRQDDHIPEDAMLEAATDFMQKSTRRNTEMHRVDDGTVVFAFPLTSEIAKVYEIQTPQTGLMIAVKPSADVLEKFASGEYTGFSIGGVRLEDEEVD